MAGRTSGWGPQRLPREHGMQMSETLILVVVVLWNLAWIWAQAEESEAGGFQEVWADLHLEYMYARS